MIRAIRSHDLRHNWVTSHAEIGTPQSVLEAQAGHLSKRMSDHYKHISEKAARKASDALARFRAEQRAEARAKMQEQTRVDTGLIRSDAMPSVTAIGNGQSAGSVDDAIRRKTTESNALRTCFPKAMQCGRKCLNQMVGGRGLEPRTSCL